jgi:hypothetical protein
VTGPDVVYHVTFGLSDKRHICFKADCGSSLTAKQPNGVWACPFHWSGEIQTELPL